MDKAALRSQMRTRRRALGASELAAAGAAATTHLVSWDVWQSAGAVALHAAVRGELPTDALIAAALGAGKRVALPSAGPEGMSLRWLNSTADLAPDARGIPSPPTSAALADLAELDLVLTPGLAFDATGGRLGQGGGDYDRLLAALPPRTTTVGWCHDFQLAEGVPMESHDRRVGWLATPSGVQRTTG